MPISDDLFHGSINGAGLRRFTDRQLAFYTALNPSAALRSRCPAGIRIGLRTDASILELEFEIVEKARDYLGIDVEVDGAIVRSIRYESPGSTLRLREQLFALKEQRSREVWIYLPLTVEIRSLELSATGTPLPAHKRQLLCLGDSITQGMASLNPSCSYAWRLARLLDANLLNQGVGGRIFEAGSLDPDLPFRPDLITVAYGVNDWATAPDRASISRRVEEYFSRLQTLFPGIPVFVVTPLWCHNETQLNPPGTLQDIRAVITGKARACNFIVIDGRPLVPHDLYYLPDGLHPNALGHSLYGANLYQQICQHFHHTA